MKWVLRILGGFTVFIAVVVVVVYVISSVGLTKKHTLQAPPLPIPDGEQVIARGEHLITLAKCGECHGDDLSGKVIIDEPLLARISGSNLTPAGPVGTRSDADLVLAIRYGLSVEGRPLLGMPTAEHFHFSDDELAAMIAALRVLPPIQNELPSQKIGIIFRALYLAGEIELVGQEKIDIHGPRPDSVAPGVSLTYGEHLARTGGCYSCHGERLAGGPMAGAPSHFPPASNITPHADGLADWSRADFARLMREGLRPDSTEIDPAMPWRYTRSMTDDEVAALWMYLQTVPSAPYNQN